MCCCGLMFTSHTHQCCYLSCLSQLRDETETKTSKERKKLNKLEKFEFLNTSLQGKLSSASDWLA